MSEHRAFISNTSKHDLVSNGRDDLRHAVVIEDVTEAVKVVFDPADVHKFRRHCLLVVACQGDDGRVWLDVDVFHHRDDAAQDVERVGGVGMAYAHRAASACLWRDYGIVPVVAECYRRFGVAFSDDFPHELAVARCILSVHERYGNALFSVRLVHRDDVVVRGDIAYLRRIRKDIHAHIIWVGSFCVCYLDSRVARVPRGD